MKDMMSPLTAIRTITPPIILRTISVLRGRARVYGGKLLVDEMEKAISNFLPTTETSNKSRKRMFRRDISLCYILYKTTPADYFLFGFNTHNTTHSLRKGFVTDSFKDCTLKEFDGWDKYMALSDKFGFYKKAEPYYGRRLCLYDKSIGKEDVIQFMLAVKGLFIKPQGGSYGHGAFMAQCDNQQSAENLYSTLKEKGGSWILEERIIQDNSMAIWNESSVNTIRFTSIFANGVYHPLTPVLRTGRRGNIVDNGGSGGILANIDLKTGIVYTDGIDECGHVYSKHPDSGIQFRGFVIPSWNELLETAYSAHTRVATDHKYIGWDFALSNGKWIVIEGNWGQFLNQYVDKVGRKDEFIKYIKSK